MKNNAAHSLTHSLTNTLKPPPCEMCAALHSWPLAPKHLTLLDTFEADRVLAVLDDGQHVPGGEPSHWHVVDLQQQLILGQFSALDQSLPLLHLTEVGELAVFRAPLQLEAQLSVLPTRDHRFVDFVGPVVFLFEALRHGSGELITAS